jgi:hypothetical protein
MNSKTPPGAHPANTTAPRPVSAAVLASATQIGEGATQLKGELGPTGLDGALAGPA